MAYQYPLNGGRINATIGGNTAGAGSLVSTGTLTLAGGNNITLSQAGNAVTISGGAGGGGGIGLANSQTTYTSGTANLNVAGGAMTIASTTGQSFNFSVPQVSSLLATGALSMSTAGGTISLGMLPFDAGISNLGNTSGTSGSNTNGLYLVGGNNITLSQSTNTAGAYVTVSGPNQSVQTQGVQTVNIGGNTAGATASISSGALSLYGGNNVTLSQNANSLTISAGAGGGGGVAMYDGVASISSGTAVFSDSNGVSFGINGQTITGSIANQTLGLYASGANTIGQSSSSTMDARSFNFSGQGAISAGYSGSTMQLSAPATSMLSATGAVSISTNGGTISIGVPNHIHSFYQNLVPMNSAQPYTTLAVGFRTMLVQPLSPVEGLGFPGDMTISTFMMQLSGSQTATSAASAWSSSYGSTLSVGLYLLNNSSQLTLINSASTGWSASANSQNSTGWAGPRFLTIHSSLWSAVPALTEGERYWYGVLHNSANFSSMGPSWLGQYIGASTQRSGTIGVSQAANTSQGMVPFLGIYSASLTAIPSSLGNSQINKVNVSAGFAPAIILNATVSAF